MREALRTQLWPLPAVGVVLAVVAGVALPELDKRIGSGTGDAATYLFGGGRPPPARCSKRSPGR